VKVAQRSTNCLGKETTTGVICIEVMTRPFSTYPTSCSTGTACVALRLFSGRHPEVKPLRLPKSRLVILGIPGDAGGEMTSAPIARHSETGTGFETPPSTIHLSPIRAGLKMPGNAMDARTA
jgi:hypothetical protein